MYLNLLFFLAMLVVSITTTQSVQAANVWTPRPAAGLREWTAISMSADGMKLVATAKDGASNGLVYASNDGGETWTESLAITRAYWYGLAASADGLKVFATGPSNHGKLHYSADGGFTWIEKQPHAYDGSTDFSDVIVVSADGTKLVAKPLTGAGPRSLLASTDGGDNWTTKGIVYETQTWISLAASNDGMKLAIATPAPAAGNNFDGYIYTSANGGTSWTKSSARNNSAEVVTLNWHSVASSADGTKLAAVVSNGLIYLSNNGGISWIPEGTWGGSTIGVRNWDRIAMSDDGTKIVATVASGPIFSSINGGQSWSEETLAGSRNWGQIVMSADGTKVAVIDKGGYIYTANIGESACGNSRLETGEVCDGNLLGGQTCQTKGYDDGRLACAADCASFVTTDCKTIATCTDTDNGNNSSNYGLTTVTYTDNSKSTFGDHCDALNPNSPWLKEFYCENNKRQSVDVNCLNGCENGACKITETGICGNGIIEAGEACDGASLNGATCGTFFNLVDEGSSLSCSADCKSFIYDNCVRPQSCSDSDAGNNQFIRGSILSIHLNGSRLNTIDKCVGSVLTEYYCDGTQDKSAQIDCQYGCENGACKVATGKPVCGNGIIETGEACDNTNFSGQTCQSLGFNGGTLTCNTNCTALSTYRCQNVTNCADTDFGNNPFTKGSITYTYTAGGTSTTETKLDVCNNNVLTEYYCENNKNKQAETTCANGCENGACRTYAVACGNGKIETGEVCDGINLNEKTCNSSDIGFDRGVLTCSTDCKSFVTTGCTTNKQICVDSDKGINKFIAGSVEVTFTNNTRETKADVCNGNVLTEQYCDNNENKQITYLCGEMGCSNGACIAYEKKDPILYYEQSTSTDSQATTSSSIRATIIKTETNDMILKLNRQISELEKKIVEMEAKLTTAINDILTNRLKGQILIQPESKGEVWYTSPETGERFYVANGQAAYDILSAMGKGITNKDLQKIAVGYDPNLYGGLKDADADDLPDVLEQALGTNINKADSDGDSFNDLTEIMGSYNPNGSGKIELDKVFAKKLKGIYLDVDNKGAAWYINPKDFKRYYISPETAYNVMKYLSLGVSNDNLRQIPLGQTSYQK